jgi:hypothetical protein
VFASTTPAEILESGKLTLFADGLAAEREAAEVARA